MDKICKKLSWIVLVSVFISLVGVIFGILAGVEAGKVSDGDGGAVAKYAIIAVALIAGLVSIITGIITYFSSRKEQVKSVVVAMGRNSTVQGIGPLACFILACVGCGYSGKTFNEIGGLVVFIVVSYIAVLFVTGLLVRGLKGFRKDKENYSFLKVVSILSGAFLLIFLIATMLTMFKVPSAAETNLVPFIETFAILFVIANIIAYVVLAILAGFAEKYAPKTTIADADAAKLDQIANDIGDIKKGQTVQDDTEKIAKIREYKKLMDEGIITKEEFETKKKELLK